MSASKEKRVREAIRSEGGSKKEIAAKEKAIKDRKFRRNTIIFIVALAIVVAASVLITSDILHTATTAVSIGDTDYSPAEFSYYYRSMYNEVYGELSEQYGEMATYFLNNQTPLDEQIYVFGDGTTTWHDYLYTYALTQLTNHTILYDAAIKEGYSVTEQDKADIDAVLEEYEAMLPGSNFSDLDAMLSYNFGKGFDTKTFRALAEKQAVAVAYANDLRNSFSYTDEEIENYYTEHADELDFISYNSYFVSSGDTAFSELPEEERAAAAHEAAELIAQATSGAEFTSKVRDFVSDTLKSSYENANATLTVNQAAGISDSYREWLTEDGRVYGDTTVIDIESGSYVLMFASRNDNHYALVNARHILINAEASEDGTYTEEALEAAKARAEELLAQWQEDPTDENFAAMANEYSEDTGSNTAGGLYEGIYKDSMVEEFDAFLFENGRQAGDAAVVYGNNGSYAGYHVVYYQGQGDMLSTLLADSAMRDADYDEAVTAIAEGYEYKIGSGMKFVEY